MTRSKIWIQETTALSKLATGQENSGSPCVLETKIIFACDWDQRGLRGVCSGLSGLLLQPSTWLRGCKPSLGWKSRENRGKFPVWFAHQNHLGSFRKISMPGHHLWKFRFSSSGVRQRHWRFPSCTVILTCGQGQETSELDGLLQGRLKTFQFICSASSLFLTLSYKFLSCLQMKLSSSKYKYSLFANW